MLFGSLVELRAWLHSYLCFSLHEKLFLKVSSTPPQHLAICRASKFFFLSQSCQILDSWWIDRESSSTLNSWWIDRASLLVSLLSSSTPPQQLHLSTLFFLTPSSTDGSTPLDTSICRELLKLYILVCCDPILISSISLDLSSPVHLSNHSLSLQTYFPSVFQFFSPSLFVYVSRVYGTKT